MSLTRRGVTAVLLAALVACAGTVCSTGVDATRSVYRPANGGHVDTKALSKLLPSGSKPSPLPHDLFAPNGGAPWKGGDVFSDSPRQGRPLPTGPQLDGPIVQTTSGTVQGYLDDGVNVWRGLPYAAPPTGDFRLREPQDPAPWNGTRQAWALPQICPQIHIFDWLYLGGEDCLYLDVYAPESAGVNDQLLPVFVWIYGGGYIIGDNYEFGLYDGHNVALARDHIIVSFNYRLGPLGFMANDALKADNPHGYAGNYALLDQVKALQWVQNNIAAFGGDPNRVTIGGESAGAFSVCWHLVSPLSKGLFHAGILESGTCNDQNFFVEYELSRNWTNTYIQMVGCNPDLPDALSCLRNLPTGAIMGHLLGSPSNSVQQNVQSIRDTHTGLMAANNVQDWGYTPKLFPLMSWGCTIDGVALLEMPLDTIASGEYNQVPVIMGTNNDEGTIFVPAMFLIIPGVHFPIQAGDLEIAMNYVFNNNATITNGILSEYPLEDYSSPEDCFDDILRDYMFVCSSRRALRAMSANNVSAWLYHWSYKGDWVDDLFFGDYHSAELEFVWDNQWPPIIHAFSPNDTTMANTVDTYWSNMVWFGNPNGNVTGGGGGSGDEQFWPTFNADTLQDMVLAVPTVVERDYFEQKCNFWDAYEPGASPARVKREAAAAAAAAKKEAPRVADM